MADTISELSIRNAIATALSGLLGTYTYTNGVTESAFKATDGAYQSADDAWPHGPEVPTVTGLEAILEVDVDSASYTPTYGRDFWMYRRCRLTLKQWTPTDTTRTAGRAVVKALNNISVFNLEVGPRVPRLPGVANIETQQIEFDYPTLS